MTVFIVTYEHFVQVSASADNVEEARKSYENWFKRMGMNARVMRVEPKEVVDREAAERDEFERRYDIAAASKSPHAIRLFLKEEGLLK